MRRWMPTPVRRAAVAGMVLAWCGLTLACETPYEQAYGRSYSDYKARTIANPEAGAEDLEARRPDGTSADNAVYKFRTQEAKPEGQGQEPSVINVDIGS